MMRVVALIPAAGRGRRMGGETSKASLLLGGIPLLARTLQKFEACPQIDEILPLVPPEEVSFWTDEIIRRYGLKKVLKILPGGLERQDSVGAGLKAIKGNADWVIVHDGARPFVPLPLIERTLSETNRWKAVVAALPAGETLKEVSPEKEVLRTVDRERLWIIQTPQCFEYGLIVRAHEKAGEDRFYGTDDAVLVERLGIPVRVIEGSRLNFKITTPEDLILGEALLKYWK
ncbi:MAG: 2-C-methyl-D-erythritol 4-phosphate cytidylyltransferase [Thermodesulfobacteriota bacterium]|nr:2-C-methyl-D-erythritol 4-phosphate cytidylyltransferase [Thermodesulfobacteriota bacterium]